MTRRPIESRVTPARTGEDHHEDALRSAFAAWASGVTVITARDDDGRVYGMTVAAFTPVSIDPPLALACVHNDAPLASVLDTGVLCAVSMLSEGQKRAATTFADRFTVPGDLLTHDDLPVVIDAAVVLVASVHAVHDGGDHRIVVLRIAEAHTRSDDLPPMLYWQRRYRRIAPGD